MIYITGDTHRDFRRFANKNFPEQYNMTKTDYVIICGDFGGVWDQQESKEEKYWLDWLEEKPFITLFIDGNHENFDRLYAYPVKEWHGGKIHEIRPSVYHLMRGQVFEIDEKKIFTFGGASSHDIDGGILDKDDPDFKSKNYHLSYEGLVYRINHLSWWKEELPSDAEMAEGWINLEKHNNMVDFIITHCCSSSTQAILSGGRYKPDVATKYLEEIKQKIKYKKWFFGHYHDYNSVSDKEILLYEQIIRIS